MTELGMYYPQINSNIVLSGGVVRKGWIFTLPYGCNHLLRMEHGT